MEELFECEKWKSTWNRWAASEMMKYASPMWLSYLCQNFNVCMKRAVVQNDWKCAIIVHLYKGKGDKYDCKNHRDISLLSIPGELYGGILIGRVQKMTHGNIWEVQCGFMPGRGCADQISTV
jgi:hypothetical protein